MGADTENRASRVFVALAGGVFDVRRDEVVEGLLAESLVRHDRRGLGAPSANGRDEWMDQYRRGVDSLNQTGWSVETIETRGDRLALVRSRVALDEDYVIERLHIVELNQEGLISLMVYFDVDDEAAAGAELDRRWSDISTI